jgi:uncharacterized BrkB/YihY/UPF0761 family membrane protein
MENVSTHLHTKNKVSVARQAAWTLLLLLALASLAFVAVPVWVIQPFRPQSQAGLEMSFMLRRLSPVLTLIASIIVLALMVWLWRDAFRVWRKALLIAALMLTLAATWFARQNHFEWMFNPLAHTAYAKAVDADFIKDADMVMAVEEGGEAVAYPVRQMAYHHVVQDVVGGVPIVATY